MMRLFAEALKGRETPVDSGDFHAVTGRALAPPYPAGLEVIVLAMGCFWGAERLFWTLPGVYVTQVGYAGGETLNPTYQAVCSGRTGHAEAVRVVFDPRCVSLGEVLRVFWTSHDPTQGNRQGNDVGSQYRSAIYTTGAAQRETALASVGVYQAALTAAGRGEITTEVRPLEAFFPAEAYHQQYLHKTPGGYCGIAGTGVDCAFAELTS